MKTFPDSIPAPPHRRRPVWGICFCGGETSPSSSHQLIQREPLAVIADFADCQSLSLWERCLRSRRRGQAQQNETRKRSDTMSLTNRVCIAVRLAFCQHPCPLRRIRASSPKGRASGGNSRLCGLPKPLPLKDSPGRGRWHASAERGQGVCEADGEGKPGKMKHESVAIQCL